MKVLEDNNNVTARKEFIKRAYNNNTYKKMKSIGNKYGYDIGLAYYASYDDFSINISRGDNRGRFLPEVYPPSLYYKEDWKVQTTSYGSLSFDEFEEFIKQQQNAFSMIKELKKLDLTTLEHEPEGKW